LTYGVVCDEITAMNTRFSPSSKNWATKHIGVTTLLVVIAVYFAFYTLYGNRGFFTLSGLNEDIRIAEQHHDELVKEREEIETHVKMMRPDSVDMDMMTQQIRQNMEYAHPDDIVINVK